MKIGILSDTHGKLPLAIRALELLLARDVGAVIHCGDIGSEELLDELATLCDAHRVPLHAVLGNVDEYNPTLRAYRAGPFVKMWGLQANLELDGKRIAVHHGHLAQALLQAISSGANDYVLTGHTHRMEDSRSGHTRVINPGAVTRANPPSIAILDLATDQLEHIPL